MFQWSQINRDHQINGHKLDHGLTASSVALGSDDHGGLTGLTPQLVSKKVSISWDMGPL
jgi:hypothetical protein